MTHLERAIAESKKREEKATKGPWVIDPPKSKEEMVVICKDDDTWTPIAESFERKDAKFISHARTWEPKWREMVEVMLVGLADIEREIVAERPAYALKALNDIFVRIERLAKEGLGENC